MEKRKCGSSDLYLSVLGMGCWQFGGGDYWGKQDQKDVDDVVSKALESGINYFDTAEVYNNGESEKSLGLALKGQREQAIIGTKIQPDKFYPDLIRDHCEASLKRLQTDYIDIYMLHWPVNRLSLEHYTEDENILSSPPNIQAGFETLAALKKEGKIGHIGISNHGVQQMKEVMDTGVDVVANELAYNQFSRGIEKEILPSCKKHGMGVISYVPLMQGLLAGKYKNIDEMQPIRTRTRHYHQKTGLDSRHGEEGAETEIIRALDQIRQLSSELGVSMATLSLAWSIANTDITSTIVGSRNLQQLEGNIQGATYALDPETLTKLNDITLPILDKLGDNPDYWEGRNASRIW